MRRNRMLGVIAALVLASLAACSPNGGKPATHDPPQHSDGHGACSHHNHAAPHGGALLPLGDHFAHIEIVLHSATGRLSLYALDKEARTGVRMAQRSVELEVTFGTGDSEARVNVSLKARASELTGETVGDTSEFQGIAEELKGVERFRGRIAAVELMGRAFRSVEFHYPGQDDGA